MGSIRKKKIFLHKKKTEEVFIENNAYQHVTKDNYMWMSVITCENLYSHFTFTCL